MVLVVLHIPLNTTYHTLNIPLPEYKMPKINKSEKQALEKYVLYEICFPGQSIPLLNSSST